MRDSIAMREGYLSYLNFLSAYQPDFIVIETATPSWPHDEEVILAIKAQVPNAGIILTGTIGANAAPVGEAPITHGFVQVENLTWQATVKGEYEKGVVDVVRGRRGIIEHQLLTIEEMNAAPFPDYPAETWDHYCDSNPLGQKFPHAQVWSSRGCPFKCLFCVWPATMTGNDPDGTGVRKVRYYSAEYMEAWLTELRDKYKFSSIYFDDDTFNMGDAHTLKMCRVMRHIGLPWSAMCRADTIKAETWAEMKASGCFGVKLGFESGSQYVIDHIINKRLNLEKARDTARYIRRLGMTIHGTFTIGLPGETAAQKQETIDFIKTLPLDSYQLSGCAEIEGTPLANLRARGHLAAYDGATTDGYSAEADGAKKYREMT
jgi:radical SAM superfamily enzyme YgiQ (UPF0313 family)